jgi:phosphatidylserine/phosphatidylglycerophosphate/cardiolipin synthase-like enzyme
MSRRLAPILAALTLALLACRPPPPATPGPASRPAARRPAPAPLELVESVPVETAWERPGVLQTADVWREMFHSARSSIDMAQFYLVNKPGEPLEPVIRELEAAGRRGVKVRVLVEQKFLRVSQQTIERLERAPNIRVAIFNIGPITGGILHAKYFVVDRREAFLGSQNFDWRALKHIHEVGLRIRDPAVVSSLLRIFEADWKYMTMGLNTYQPPAPAGGPADPPASKPRPPYLVASPPGLNPPGTLLAAGRLIALLNGARRRIDVQLLSYSTWTHAGKRWTRIDEALRRAARRGVRVRLNVSNWNLRQPEVRAIQELASEPNVEVKVNTIPAYSGGFIPHARVDHSKFMILDGRTGWVGTSNWSGDYFTASRNVELVFQAPRVVRKLSRLFDRGWSGPYAQALDPGRRYTPPRIK